MLRVYFLEAGLVAAFFCPGVYVIPVIMENKTSYPYIAVWPLGKSDGTLMRPQQCVFFTLTADDTHHLTGRYR